MQQGGRGTCEVEPLRDAPVGGMCRHRACRVIASELEQKSLVYLWQSFYDGGLIVCHPLAAEHIEAEGAAESR